MKNLLTLVFGALLIMGMSSCGGGKQATPTTPATNVVAPMTAASNTNASVVSNTQEVKAADLNTKSSVKKMVEKDAGQSMGLE